MDSFGDLELRVQVVKGGFIMTLPVIATNDKGETIGARYETSVVNSQRKVIQAINDCLKDFKLTQE